MERRRAPSPGILAALRARRIALLALYWGPIIFLLATIALVMPMPCTVVPCVAAACGLLCAEAIAEVAISISFWVAFWLR